MTTIAHRKIPDCHDLDILAKTIYGEARGEGNLGREAVGCTVINRWRSGKWFNGYDTNNDGVESIAEVCQQIVPNSKWHQYSCWNADNPALGEIKNCNLYNAVFRDCVTMALHVIANSADARWAGRDESKGATHYHAEYIATPVWAVGKKPCAIVGKHRFFRDIA